MTACPRCGFDPETATPTLPAPACDCFAIGAGAAHHSQTCATTRWMRGELVADTNAEADMGAER